MVILLQPADEIHTVLRSGYSFGWWWIFTRGWLLIGNFLNIRPEVKGLLGLPFKVMVIFYFISTISTSFSNCTVLTAYYWRFLGSVA